MATLRLESYDGSVLELPDLCMKCGAPAAVRKKKKFSWFPQWIWILFFVCGVIPFAIVASIMTKRCRVEAPLCEEHKNHWFWRQVVVLGGLLLLLVTVFGSVVLMDNQRGRGDDPLSGVLCVGSAIGLIIWLIVIAVLQYTSIRPAEITDTSIKLVGVSDVFVQAYEDEWRPLPERLDEQASERWNQGKHRPRAGHLPDGDADRIQRAEEDEDDR